MAKRFQNKVAESKFALPFTASYALLVWLAGGLIEDYHLWACFACMVASTYLMVELNNTNALIRTYSRMVSCTFLVLTSMSVFLFGSMQAAIVEVCTIAFYTFLFHTYQDKQSPGWTFYAFFCLGLASLVFGQVLFLVPLLWLLMATKLMSLSWRTFRASILGLLAPYWFAAAIYCARLSRQDGIIDEMIARATSLVESPPTWQELLSHVWSFPEWPMVEHSRMAVLAYVIVLTAVGSIHFLRKSYLDKIRTRMIFESLVSISVFTLILVVLMPHEIDALLGIMIVNASILFAHFVALTRTRWTNILFIALLVTALVLTICNLWIPL